MSIFVRQLLVLLLFSGASASELPSLVKILTTNPRTVEDAYDLFNVTPDISDRDLETLRRVLVVKYQPRSKADEAQFTDIAARINAAYTLIRTSRKPQDAAVVAQPARRDPDLQSIQDLLKRHAADDTFFLPGQLEDLTKRYLQLSPLELSHLFDEVKNIHFNHVTRLTGFIVDNFSTEQVEQVANQLMEIWKQYALWQSVNPLHYKRKDLKSPVTIHDVLRPRLEQLSSLPRTHHKDLSARNWPRSFWLDKVRQTKNLIVCYKMRHDEESLASLQRILLESEALQKSFFYYRELAQTARTVLDEMLKTYPLDPPSYGTGKVRQCMRLFLPRYNQLMDRFVDRKDDGRPTYDAFGKPWQRQD